MATLNATKKHCGVEMAKERKELGNSPMASKEEKSGWKSVRFLVIWPCPHGEEHSLHAAHCVQVQIDSVGQCWVLHGFTWCVNPSAQGVPPFRGSRVTILLLERSPPPQDWLQGNQKSHSPSLQSTGSSPGQKIWLQTSTRLKAPSQGRPASCAKRTTCRLERCCPPPHSREQADQEDHGVMRQSTAWPPLRQNTSWEEPQGLSSLVEPRHASPPPTAGNSMLRVRCRWPVHWSEQSLQLLQTLKLQSLTKQGRPAH